MDYLVTYRLNGKILEEVVILEDFVEDDLLEEVLLDILSDGDKEYNGVEILDYECLIVSDNDYTYLDEYTYKKELEMDEEDY
jgi:hypothetical protein